MVQNERNLQMMDKRISLDFYQVLMYSINATEIKLMIVITKVIECVFYFLLQEKVYIEWYYIKGSIYNFNVSLPDSFH